MKSWGAWRGSIRISACWMYFAQRWRGRGIHGWMRRSASGGGGANKGSAEVMEQRGKDFAWSPCRGQNGRKMKRKDDAETPRTLRSAERPRRIAGARRKLALTTPDLVLLSLLAERPMHGYQANLELERREIRDWAGISRPQVYYSLEKLARAGLIRSLETDEPAAGPERSTFETTAKGSAALANALELEEETLKSVLAEVGHRYHEAVWMIELMIEQFRTELRWLKKLAQELPKRERAKRPSYTGTAGVPG